MPAQLFAKRDFSAKRRQKAAEAGHALPDGSFPIENVGDLRNAERLVGHAEDPHAAAELIRRRAKELGAKTPFEVEKAWSDEARRASAEARRSGMSRPDRIASDRKYFAQFSGRKKPKGESKHIGPRIIGGAVGGIYGHVGGLRAGAAAREGLRAAGRGAQRAGAAMTPKVDAGLKRKMERAENLAARPGTPGESAAARAAADKLKAKMGTGSWQSRLGERLSHAGAGLERSRAVGRLGLAGALAGTAYGAYRGQAVAASTAYRKSDDEARDDKGRWTSGLGEHLGGVAGIAAGVYHAPKAARAAHALVKRPRTIRARGHSFTFPGFRRRVGRAGVAALAAYGAVRVGGAAGSYVGRKIDQAVSKSLAR